MPDVQSLIYDQDEEILVGTYEGPLSQMTEVLPGNNQQPTISWKSCGFKRSQAVHTKPGIFTRGLRRLGVLKRPKRPPAVEKQVNGFKELMDSFVDAICHGGEPMVNGANTLPTLELMPAIVLSAMRSKTVELPINRAEYDALFEEPSPGKVYVPRFEW